MMQLHMLSLLGENKEFYNFIEKFYKKDYAVCNIYVNHLEKDGKTNEAILIAERGIDLFPQTG